MRKKKSDQHLVNQNITARLYFQGGRLKNI